MGIKTYDRYKETNTEWIGNIPVHWDTKKIKYLSPVKRGASPRPIDDPKYFDDDGEYAWVRIADVSASNKYLTTTTQKMSQLGSSLSVKLNPGEMFLSIAGTVGKPCITNIKCCIHDGFVYFPNLNEEIREYLYYIFETGLPYKGLGKLGTQLNLNTQTVGDIFIPIPEKNEIIKIVNFIKVNDRSIQELILSAQKQIEVLQKYRRSLITEIVTKGLEKNVALKHTGIEWIGAIPTHWELKKLKNVSEIQLSNVDKKTVEGDIPVSLCNYTDVYYNDEITDHLEFMQATAKREQVKKFNLKKNDLIITKDSESPTDIAVPAWVSIDFDKVLCGYHLALIRPHEQTNGKYLFYSLKSTIGEQFYSRATGVTRFGLSKESIKNALFIIPPLHEQIAIGNYLDAINKEINRVIVKIEDRIKILKDYRQSLIYEVVTGKIDVRNYNPSQVEVKI